MDILFLDKIWTSIGTWKLPQKNFWINKKCTQYTVQVTLSFCNLKLNS